VGRTTYIRAKQTPPK